MKMKLQISFSCHLSYLFFLLFYVGNFKYCSAWGSKRATTVVQNGTSIKTFGAIGDGIKNDRAAIQKALSKSGIIYFPAGTYRVDGFIKVADDVTIVGQKGNLIIASANMKTDLKTGSSHQGQIFILGNNNSVEGLNIDGKNFKAGGFCVSKVKNSAVVNCVISNTGNAQAIQDYLTNNSKYVGNTLTNTLSGIQLWLTKNCTITNNKANRCGNGGIWGANAANITCSNNTVQNCADVGIDWEGGQNITTKLNTVSSCKNGELAVFKTAAEGNQHQENILFLNNTITRKATYLSRKNISVACSPSSGAIFVSSVNANCNEISFKANIINVKFGFAFFTNDITQPNTKISFTDNIINSSDKFFRIQGTDGLLIKSNNFKGLAGSEAQSNEFKNASGIRFEANTFSYDITKKQTSVLTWFTDRPIKGDRPLLIRNRFLNTADLALKHDPYISGVACVLEDNALTVGYTANGGITSTGNGGPLYKNQTLKTKVHNITRDLLLNTVH